MTEPGVPNQQNDSAKKSDEYPADANPYRQPSYDQNNPYSSNPSAGAGYPSVPPTPPAGPTQGYPQQGYGQTGYDGSAYPVQTQGAPYGYTPVVNPEGKSKADYALIFGIVGIFFFSLVFGILALVYAKKAEELGADAKAGKILGWVDIGISILGFLWLLLMIPLMFMGGEAANY